MNAAALFADPGRFDCHTPQPGFGPGDYWVMSAYLPIIPAADNGHIVVSANVWQDAVTLYILSADGTLRRTGFTSRRIGSHLALGAVFTMRIASPTEIIRPVRLLWHVKGAANTRGIVVEPRLRDDASTQTFQMNLAGVYGGFIGLATALFVYNVALWAALRQRFQLVYCALMLCLVAYALTTSGAITLVFPGFGNNDRMRLNVLLLGAFGAGTVLFARSFFERRVFDGPTRPISTVVMAALVGTSVLLAVTAPWHVAVTNRLQILAFVGLLGIVPPVLWRAWRTQSRYLWLFALAWGVPIAVSAMRVAGALGMVPWRSGMDDSTLVSMMLESLLSCLVIAFRIKLLSRERDEAREQEIAARILADVDPLTGLLNRRAFLTRALARTGDQTLLIADLDHFRIINETLGHDGGDEVLRMVGNALRASVPLDALVARLGGEEFAILVDARAPSLPADILARLRRERLPFDMRVTASIGCCTGPMASEADWNALYRAADRALYEAKAAGRDRARTAPPIAA